MSTVDQALLINVIVLFVVLEADVGPHRKIGWFRIARPLVLAGTIVPVYLKSLTTHGTGLYLELAGTAAGILLGLIATGLMKVYRSPKTGRPVSRADFGYAILWIIIIGARSAFSYGSAHWFGPQLGTWMTAHHVVSGALTDTLLLMALGMLLTRTLGLAVRAHALPPPAPATAAAPSPSICWTPAAASSTSARWRRRPPRPGSPSGPAATATPAPVRPRRSSPGKTGAKQRGHASRRWISTSTSSACRAPGRCAPRWASPRTSTTWSGSWPSWR